MECIVWKNANKLGRLGDLLMKITFCDACSCMYLEGKRSEAYCNLGYYVEKTDDFDIEEIPSNYRFFSDDCRLVKIQMEDREEHSVYINIKEKKKKEKNDEH